MKSIRLISASVCLILSCQKYSGPSNPEPLVPEQPKRLTVSPIYCVIGTAITFSDTGFHNDMYADTLIFTGNIEIHADSANATTLHARVPFGAFSGYVTVKAPNYRDSVQITILESYNPDTFAVRWYDLEDSITSDAAKIPGYYYSPTAYWSVSRSVDTITFEVQYAKYPDETRRFRILFLDHGADTLPSLLFARCTTPLVYTTGNGLLKIQDWNTSAIVSAKFFCSRSSPFNQLALWHDFRQ